MPLPLLPLNLSVCFRPRRGRFYIRIPYDRCGNTPLHLPFSNFHVDHIIPRKHGGSDATNNLALSCYHCNLHKGANLTGIDPDTGAVGLLFHPRRDTWNVHFALYELRIAGLTATGRITLRVLNMNAADRIHLRRALQRDGFIPPHNSSNLIN